MCVICIYVYENQPIPVYVSFSLSGVFCHTIQRSFHGYVTMCRKFYSHISLLCIVYRYTHLQYSFGFSRAPLINTTVSLVSVTFVLTCRYRIIHPCKYVCVCVHFQYIAFTLMYITAYTWNHLHQCGGRMESGRKGEPSQCSVQLLCRSRSNILCRIYTTFTVGSKAEAG